ncbi:MAG: hypothetical protein RSC06_15385 [Clostridia bacterium]
MFKKIAETLIGGAIGAVALYIVGRFAYQAGQAVAHEEHRYNAMREANEKPHDKIVPIACEQEEVMETKETTIVPSAAVTECHHRKKQSKLGLFFGVRKLFGDKKSVIGNLVHEPEAHKFEAFVEGDELQIHVKRREGC